MDEERGDPVMESGISYQISSLSGTSNCFRNIRLSELI